MPTPRPTFKGLVFKAIRKDGLWVVTAIVRGQVEEFSGRKFIDATALLARALAKRANPQEMAQELAHEINSGLGDRQATVHVGTLLI